MHPSEGELRAYNDDELGIERSQQIRTHLEDCMECREKANAILACAGRVQQRILSLDAGAVTSMQPTQTGRARLMARLNANEKETEPMLKKIFAPRFRLAWSGAAVVTLLAVSLAFSPVRAIANSFLGLFRVQQIKVVEVNPMDLPENMDDSAEFEMMFSNDMKFTESGELQEAASAEEASALAGIPVRTPAAFDGKEKFTVQPGGVMEFNINLEHVNALLADIGRTDIQLPEALDGAQVTVEIARGVSSYVGDCRLNDETPEDPDASESEVRRSINCTSLTQMPSPSISAPPGLDVAAIGQAYLELVGMSREEAALFSQTVDWTTTFVVPVPRYNASYEEVQVDGVSGALIKQHSSYLLMWVKDGTVYALSGKGDGEQALAIANSMQ